MMGMMLWMAVFWTIVIGGGAWLLSRGRRSGADDALQMQLARGEIDVAEFERQMAARQRSMRRPLIAVLIAVMVLVAIPAVVMATGSWHMDMRGMHRRGQDTAGDPVVRTEGDARVLIEDFAFEPGNVEVSVGARVTWTNDDSAPHDATARDGSWETARLSRSDSDTLTFEASGTYEYYCSIHPSMKARLTVR